MRTRHLRLAPLLKTRQRLVKFQPTTANIDTETTAASSSDGAHIIRTWPQGGDPEEPNPDKFKSIMPLTIVTFTPTGIREFGVQRSKSFIRKTFGIPDSVEEGENSWMYSTDNAHLKVLDEDAGKRVFVRLSISRRVRQRRTGSNRSRYSSCLREAELQPGTSGPDESGQ